MKVVNLFLAALCCGYFFSLTLALYEDEVGKFDWHKEHIGRVTHAEFHSSKSKKQIYVCTDSNVIAALSMKTGDILWRRILDPAEPVDLIVHHGSHLVSVSGHGKHVRLWDSDGGLVWDQITVTDVPRMPTADSAGDAPPSSPVDAEMVEVGEKEWAVAVLAYNTVQVRALSDGRLLWSHQPPQPVLQLSVPSHDSRTAVHALWHNPSSSSSSSSGGGGGGHWGLITYNIKDDTMKQSQGFAAPQPPPGAPASASGAALQLLGSEVLYVDGPLVQHYSSAADQLTNYPLSPFFGGGGGGPQGLDPHRPPVVQPVGTSQGFLVQQLPSAPSSSSSSSGAEGNTSAAIFKLNAQEKRLTMLTQWSHGGHVRVLAQASTGGGGGGGGSGTRWLALQTAANEVALLDVGCGSLETFTLSPAHQAEHGPLEVGWLQVVPRPAAGKGSGGDSQQQSSSSPPAFRLLLRSRDHALHLLETAGPPKGVQVSWVREEGLGSLQVARLLPLLPEPADAPSTAAVAAAAPGGTGTGSDEYSLAARWINRVSAHWNQLLAALRSVGSAGAESRDGGQTCAPNHGPLESDRFGMRQLVVGYAALGRGAGSKLYAVHSEQGSLVWTKYLPQRHLHHMLVVPAAATAHSSSSSSSSSSEQQQQQQQASSRPSASASHATAAASSSSVVAGGKAQVVVLSSLVANDNGGNDPLVGGHGGGGPRIGSGTQQQQQQQQQQQPQTLTWYSAVTGAELRSETPTAYRIVQISLAPAGAGAASAAAAAAAGDGGAGELPATVLALDDKNVLHVLPEPPSTVAAAAAAALLPPLPVYYHVANSTASTLTGYAVQPLSSLRTGSSSSSSQQHKQQQPLWSVNFKPDHIVAVAQAPWDEPQYSATRVLGDKTALGKYVDKHLVAVATVQPPPPSPAAAASSTTDTASTAAAAAGGALSGGGTLNIYLIDGVTGRVVYHTYHRHCGGPVHIVISDNWVLYNYWAGRPLQSHFTVLELFEPDFDLLAAQQSPPVWSSWNATGQQRRPQVQAQTYTFESAVDTLAVTRTLHGIASKAVIVGLASGQLLWLPKAWFDPRRPQPQLATQADRDEGLLPYAPEIPLQPRSYLNYYKRIGRLRMVETGATALESTTLVVGVGLDLFFARLSPSGTFDQLAQDFSPVELVSTLLFVLLLSIVTSVYARRKDLLRRWK